MSIRRFTVGMAVVVVVIALPLTLGPTGPSTDATLDTVTRAQLLKVDRAYGNLPLGFEENRGQTNARAKFFTRGQGYALFLTPTEAVLSVPGPLSADDESGLRDPPAVLRISLDGADSDPEMVGLDQLPGEVNYFLGNEPEQWLSGVPTYAKVAYRDVCPGVDVVYYGNQSQVEYDLIVSPSANPEDISICFEGAKSIELDSSGDLVLQTSQGSIRQRKPQLYQVTGGRRQRVTGSYVLRTGSRAGFEVGAYDATRPLVIDPTIVYSTYLGGSCEEPQTAWEGRGYAIAVGRDGSAYVTGIAYSTDFPTENALQPDYGGDPCDVFVTKLDPTGTTLVFSTYLGGGVGPLGGGSDLGWGIAVDSSGNSYITGCTSSSDFPTAAPLQAELGGKVGSFVTKLDATGSSLLYSTYLGGTHRDYGRAIAVDSVGCVYVTGDTYSVNFPTVAAYQSAHGGGERDAFLSKLNADGSALVYSTYLGGSGDEAGRGLSLGSGDSVCVAGETSSPDFPTVSPHQGALSGTQDAWIARVTPDGSALVFSTYLGGSAGDGCYALATDSAGNVHVAGVTSSIDYPTLNPLQGWCGYSDGHVARFSPTGVLLYATFLGGSDYDSPRGIAVDAFGCVHVVGIVTPSAEFPIQDPIPDVTGGGTYDAFVAKINAAGTALVYASYLGGTGDDYGHAIALDPLGNAYVTGATTSTDFPIVNAVQPAKAGIKDAFIAKIVEALPPSCNPSGGGVYELGVDTITLGGTVSDNDGDLVSYQWRKSADVLFSGSVQTTAGGAPATLPQHTTPSADLGLGAHTLVLAVDDGLHDEVTAEITVEVKDTQAPTMAPASSHGMLWPLDHDLTEVTIQANASDSGGGSLQLSVEISSNEPIDGPGDGSTEPDYEVLSIDQETGEIRLNLRAERSGVGDGRIYTVTITATDETGNSSVAELTILVPHSRGQGNQ